MTSSRNEREQEKKHFLSFFLFFQGVPEQVRLCNGEEGGVVPGLVGPGPPVRPFSAPHKECTDRTIETGQRLAPRAPYLHSLEIRYAICEKDPRPTGGGNA